MSQPSGGAPVWVAVLCARVVGGLGVGFASYALLVSAQPAVGASAGWSVVLTLVPSVIGALCTGLAIAVLLPSVADRTVDVGNAVLAAFAGGMIPLIAGLLVIGSAAGAASGSIVAIAGAGIMLTLLMQVLGIAVTAWMVASSSSPRERPESRPADPDPTRSSIGEIDEEPAEPGRWGWTND